MCTGHGPLRFQSTSNRPGRTLPTTCSCCCFSSCFGYPIVTSITPSMLPLSALKVATSPLLRGTMTCCMTGSPLSRENFCDSKSLPAVHMRVPSGNTTIQKFLSSAWSTISPNTFLSECLSLSHWRVRKTKLRNLAARPRMGVYRRTRLAKNLKFPSMPARSAIAKIASPSVIHTWLLSTILLPRREESGGPAHDKTGDSPPTASA
mmetsp:Transcript_8960/g.17391  ORF Transcript_8960/g.17391 Transcript_8960/m.17391 type:complete len:206 (-) Transcript_8960:266-883(-)